MRSLESRTWSRFYVEEVLGSFGWPILRSRAAEQPRRLKPITNATLRAPREARRKGFEQAQNAGLSLREIGEAVDLHWTTVGQILEGK